jgi:ATP-binding cassette, subfamily B, bacterial MsbA
MKKMLMNLKPVRAAIEGINFFADLGARPVDTVIPTILYAAAAFAEGASVALLIPTVQGAIGKSFNFIYNTPILKHIVVLMPENFPKKNTAIFCFLVGAIFAMAIMKNVLSYIASLMATHQLLEVANNTRKVVFGRYLSFGKMFFDRASAGHLHQILSGYTQQVAQELKIMQGAVFSICSLIVYLGIAFFISWKLTLFSGIVFPITHYSFNFLVKKIEKTSGYYAATYSEMGTKISNTLSCIMLIKAYRNEEKEKQWFSYTSERVRDLWMSIQKKQLLIYPIQEIAGLCVMLLLTGSMAFLLVPGKPEQLAGFMVFFLVLRRAAQNFGVFNQIQMTLAGIRGPLKEIHAVLVDQDKFFVPEGNKVFPGFREKLEVKGLNFSYGEDQGTLTDLSFSVIRGETVALVGASGSGKTTLAHLLMRFYDSPPGTIFIDGADIREFTLTSYLKKMALVSQETPLLNASFKTNLLYGLNREVSDEEINAVLDRSRLASLVLRIGLDVPIGDRGIQLSGGERQRLSIARAMLKNPDILILDEATSALDGTTEKLVQETMEAAMAGKTVIVIAHRLSTVQNADKIVVMEKGMKVEEGTFPDLLSNKEGAFHFYWNQQKLGGGT